MTEENRREPNEPEKGRAQPKGMPRAAQGGAACAGMPTNGRNACGASHEGRGTTPQEGYAPPQGNPADAARAGGISAGLKTRGEGAAPPSAGGPQKVGSAAYRRPLYMALAVVCFLLAVFAWVCCAFSREPVLFYGGIIAVGAGVMLIVGRGRREGWGLLTMAAVCFAFALGFCIDLAFGWSSVLLHCALTFAGAGVLFLLGLLHCRRKAAVPMRPLRALILDLAGFLCLYFSTYGVGMGALFFLSIFTFLAGLICPVVGLAMGILSLCDKACRQNRFACACAVLSIALPVFALLLTILLFSTGVWVIALM